MASIMARTAKKTTKKKAKTTAKPLAKKAKKAVSKKAAKARPIRALKSVASKSTPRTASAPSTVERFKKELLKRREQILSYQQNIEAHGITSSEEPGDLVDRSEEVEAWITRESMNQHVSDELSHIENALRRMDAGEFGICSACEEPIPMSRLRVRPDATLCLPCQEMSERHNATGVRRPPAAGMPFGSR